MCTSSDKLAAKLEQSNEPNHTYTAQYNNYRHTVVLAASGGDEPGPLQAREYAIPRLATRTVHEESIYELGSQRRLPVETPTFARSLDAFLVRSGQILDTNLEIVPTSVLIIARRMMHASSARVVSGLVRQDMAFRDQRVFGVPTPQ